MSEHRPLDVEGECNAWHQFNDGTLRCHLPPGHDGWHEQIDNWVRENDGICWRWERNWRPEMEADDARMRGYDDSGLADELVPQEPGEDYLAAFCVSIEEQEDWARWKEECAEETKQALIVACNRDLCDDECPAKRGCFQKCRVCGEEAHFRCPHCRLWRCLDHGAHDSLCPSRPVAK